MIKVKKPMVVIMILVLLLSIPGCGKSGSVSKDTFPKGQINIHVPFGVGGNLDLKARLVAKFLEEELGTPVVIVNKTGASGVVGTTEFLLKDATCSELVFLPDSTLCLSPLVSKVGFGLEDFEYIRGFDVEKGALYVNQDKTGIHNYEELLKFGEKNRLIFGSGGAATTQYLLQKTIFNMNDIDSDTLQHTNQSEGFTNVIGGHSDIVWGGKNMTKQYVESGNLVPILNFSEEAWDDYAGFTVPTAKSLGLDLFFESFTFFAVKKGAPKDEVAVIEAALDKIYKSAIFQEEMKKFDPTMMMLNADDTKKLLEEIADNLEELVELAKEIVSSEL